MTDPKAACVDPLSPPTDENDSRYPDQANPETPVPRRWTAGILVSWLVIFAGVAVIQWSHNRPEKAAPQGFTQDTAMQVTGRYLVGMKSLLGSIALNSSISQIETMRENFKNSHTRLFFIPVLVELAGPDNALPDLQRLAAIQGDNPEARDAAVFLRLYSQGSDTLSRQQRREVEKYGWIGHLALSYGKSSLDPARRAVIHSAVRAFVATVIFVLGALAALAAGTILFITAIILWRNKRLRGCFSPPQNPGAPLLEAFAIFLTGMIVLPAGFGWMLPGFQTAAVILAIPAVILAIIWPRIRGSKWQEYRIAIGWHCGQGVVREIGSGILGYLAGLPLLFLMLIPAMLLSRYSGTVPTHPIANEINGNPVTMVFIMALACIWAPVVEETLFRGVLFGYLCRRLHWMVSGIFTGFLFAIIHPQGWIAVPVLASIGFTLCAIRQWRGSIIASMTAHALNNGAVLLFAFAILT